MSKIQAIRKKVQLKQTPAIAFINSIINCGVNFDNAVTLTFPYTIKDHIVADGLFGKFIKYLNERCYRHNKKLKIKVVALQEGIHFKHNHFHCAFKRPSHLTQQDFEYLIVKVWRKVVRNNEVIIDVKNYYSHNWLNYITKEMTQLDSTNISQHCNY